MLLVYRDILPFEYIPFHSHIPKWQIELIFIQIFIQKLVLMSQRVQFTPVQIWLVPFWLDPMQLHGISSNIKYNWQHVTDRSNCYNSHGMIQSDMLYSVYTSFHLFNHPFFVNEGDNVLWEFQMRNWPSFHRQFGTWMLTVLHRWAPFFIDTIFWNSVFIASNMLAPIWLHIV